VVSWWILWERVTCAAPVAEQTAESEGARTRAMLSVIRGLVHRTSRYRGHCALVGLENQGRRGAAINSRGLEERMRW
jgi:hypothetical protein